MGDFTDITTRTSSDPNSSADINTLNDNDKYNLDAQAYRNEIKNPNFALWQNGITFATPSQFTPLADGYAVGSLSGGSTSGTFTISRQEHTQGQTDIPGNPRYFLRWDQTVAGDRTVCKFVSFSTHSARKLANKKVTFVLYFRSDINVSSTNWKILINFGTGGSPSSDVLIDIPIDLSVTAGAGWTKHQFTVTIPSDSGKTYGTDENDAIALDFGSVQEINNNICYFDLAGCGCFIGNAVPSQNYFLPSSFEEVNRIGPKVIQFKSDSAVAISTPANNVWYNPAGHSIIITSPGVWRLRWHSGIQCTPDGASTRNRVLIYGTASTNASAQTDPNLSTYEDWNLVGDIITSLNVREQREKDITVTTAPQTWYLLIKAQVIGGSISVLQTAGGTGTTIIEARRIS